MQDSHNTSNTIKIYGSGSNAFIESRDLYNFLQVPVSYAKWIAKSLKGFERNIDYQRPEMYKKHEDTQIIFTHYGEFILTIDTAKEIARIRGGQKGLSVYLTLAQDNPIGVTQN